MKLFGKITRQMRIWAVGLTLVMSLALLSPAGAAEFGTGIYMLGYQSSLAGYMPDPGFYLRNDFYAYQGNARIMPFSGRVEVDLRSRLITDMVAGSYVTPLKILGANYAVGLIWSSVTNSFLKGTLSFDTRFPNLNRFLDQRFGGSEAGSYTGVSDLVITPVSLGWHLGQFHIMAFGNWYAPVGSYNAERRLNTGLNRWALEPNVAVTWLQPQYGQEVSLSLGYTVNVKNPATQYTTGQELHLEYYLGQHLPLGFAAGLTGYIYNQMTADTGTGATLGAFHGQTIALGPCLSFNGKIGSHAIGVSARYYNELKVHNRFDGQACYLTLSLGL
ncbi:MAG: SphA family protein [Desulfobaccales bacterium]